MKTYLPPLTSLGHLKERIHLFLEAVEDTATMASAPQAWRLSRLEEDGYILLEDIEDTKHDAGAHLRDYVERLTSLEARYREVMS